MVECQETSGQSQGDFFEVQTDRRVIRSLKKFTDGQNAKRFIASASMFAHNAMDGKAQILSPEQMLSAE